MEKTGITDLPLHYGRTPRWLFQRMKKLAFCINKIIISEYGTKNYLHRISNPFFFQSLSCVLGFDWHSSGTTTTTTAVLKETLNQELGIFVCGGKGKTSRKTPEEILKKAQSINLNDKKISSLVYKSKIVAKVDNSALQDGFRLYHHAFFFDEKGSWAVVQQGMQNQSSYARRYHWFNTENFTNDPHEAVCCDIKVKTLNMVAKESKEARKASLDLIKENPLRLKKFFTKQKTLSEFSREILKMQREHFPKIKFNFRIFERIEKLHKEQPETYEGILTTQGIGEKTIRALALISNLIYGSELSWRDPVKYAFAHGGKDGFPYPVDKRIYDKSIKILKDAVENSELERKEKLAALKRLKDFIFL